MNHTATENRPSPAPQPGGVYLLLAGLCLGLLLGPMVLGRVASGRFADWLPNPVAAQLKLDAIEKTRRTLAMTDVSPVAWEEYDQQRQAEVDDHHQTIERARALRSVMDALLIGSLCGLGVMNIASRGSRLHHRLLLGSHLLLGAWLSLFVAQPYLLADLPRLIVLGSLLLIGMLLALPPYQRKASNVEQADG
ncbi:MAG: hypothetical protein ACF8OB_13675 [Phycisphaeraceae bacterium JB051]